MYANLQIYIKTVRSVKMAMDETDIIYVGIDAQIL